MDRIDNNSFGLLMTAMIIIIFIIGIIVGTVTSDDTWKTDTVNRKLAIHCPLDGNWAWNGECDK